MRADDRAHLADLEFRHAWYPSPQPVGEGRGPFGCGEVVDRDVDGAGTGALDGDLLQPRDRLRGRPHLLPQFDAPAVEFEERLDRERGAEQRLRRPDAPAAAQVVQGVDVEEGGGPPARFSAAATTSSSEPPASATCAAASTQKPSAMPTMRVSTTRTGTGASFAASTAAS